MTLARPQWIARGRTPRRWRPVWTQTIRFRLTVTYSVLLFGLAALVVGGVYLAISQTVDAAPLNPITVSKVKETSNGRYELKPGEEFQAADLASVQQAVNYRALQDLRDYSLLALGGLLLASLAVGWWLSGRALRPVRRITAAAQEISASDLSRRINLDGPHDELRSLADTVDDMLGRLDSAFTAQRHLIDDASHELRNPLAVIQTNMDAVLSRDDVAPEERRQASIVTGRAIARMSRLVEDLLAAARRAAPAFTETNLDLGGLAAEAADEYDLVANGDRVRLTRRLQAGVLVIGDREAIRRAVDNLLSNAIRFAPEDSEVVFAVGARTGWAYVAVRDDGPGLSTTDQERVFDRFWRGELRGRRHRDRATGLGLAIVRQVVESHGGAVAVHSTPGAGSTFVLWIPTPTEPGQDFTTRTPRPPDINPLSRPSP